MVDFETVAESIPYIVWLSSPDGSTDYFNRRGTEYTGLPRQATYGWGWVDLVHEQDALPARQAWEEATRTRTPFDLSYRIRRDDGVFRWHAFRAVPVRGANGEVRRWIGTAIDIDDALAMASCLAAIERQGSDLLGLLRTSEGRSEAFGQVEEAVRAIQVNALLGADRSGTLGPLAAAGGHSKPGATDPLSVRERDVIGLVALGYTNGEAANQLAVSLRTVESRRASAMRKLGLASRAQLVRYAFDSGLLGAGLLDRP